MHKLILIKEAMMTRDVKLQNSDTETVDFCFDDSALVSNKNFEFMEINREYNCKIKLFGEPVNRWGEDVVECELLSINIFISKRLFVCVKVQEDIYNVLQNKIENILGKNKFLFNVSRKDLIQVNDVIHNDLL